MVESNSLATRHAGSFGNVMPTVFTTCSSLRAMRKTPMSSARASFPIRPSSLDNSGWSRNASARWVCWIFRRLSKAWSVAKGTGAMGCCGSISAGCGAISPRMCALSVCGVGELRVKSRKISSGERCKRSGRVDEPACPRTSRWGHAARCERPSPVHDFALRDCSLFVAVLPQSRRRSFARRPSGPRAWDRNVFLER